jgi:hypothetical protein
MPAFNCKLVATFDCNVNDRRGSGPIGRRSTSHSLPDHSDAPIALLVSWPHRSLLIGLPRGWSSVLRRAFRLDPVDVLVLAQGDDARGGEGDLLMGTSAQGAGPAPPLTADVWGRRRR